MLLTAPECRGKLMCCEFRAEAVGHVAERARRRTDALAGGSGDRLAWGVAQHERGGRPPCDVYAATRYRRD